MAIRKYNNVDSSHGQVSSDLVCRFGRDSRYPSSSPREKWLKRTVKRTESEPIAFWGNEHVCIMDAYNLVSLDGGRGIAQV